ncbi:hypothetical protein D3C71_1947660 [compost metagenome]
MPTLLNTSWMPSGAKYWPIQPLSASRAVSEMPATAVGSANGRSTSASMIFLPGKL